MTIQTLNNNVTLLEQRTKINANFAELDTRSAIGGVAVTGTPTAGQVPIATSGTAAEWGTLSSSGIAATIFDAKGDLIAASAADTAARLAVGTNGQVLSADSAEATGLKWVTPSAGSPGGSTTQVQFNDAGAFAGASGLTWDKTTNTLTIASGTQTASNPLVYTQTFNNAAVDFVGKSNDFTNTASGSGTLLERWRVGGSAVASIDKTGVLLLASGITCSGGGVSVKGTTGQLMAWSGGAIGFSSAGTVSQSTSLNVAIMRSADGVLAVTDGTAGTFRDLRLRNVRTEATVVGSLVAAATAGAGARGFVTDANSTTFGAAAVGGGANKVPVYSDGTGWFIG